MRESQIFVINRGMSTKVELPDGSIFYPASDIPPMNMVGVELSHDGRYEEIALSTDNLLANIATKLSDSVGDTADAVDEVIAEQADNEEDQVAAVGLARIRKLQFLAQDVHAFDMLEVEDDTTEMTAEEFAEVANQQKLAGTLASRLHSKQAAPDQDPLADDSNLPAKLGSELVNRIIQETSDGGLSWIYATLNEVYSHFTPTDRASMVFFANE